MNIFGALLFFAAFQMTAATPQSTWGPPLSGKEAEDFLRTARIDSSRAFRNHHELRREASLDRFSRKVLASLRALDRDQLVEKLKPWLTKRQLEALWIRRGLILDLAERRVAEVGEETALFD